MSSILALLLAAAGGSPSAEEHGVRWLRGEGTSEEQRLILRAFERLADERTEAVVACFERYLKTNPFPESCVVAVETLVNPLGRIEEVRDVVRDVSPYVQHHGGLVDCVKDALQWMQIDVNPPSGTVLVEVHYLFRVSR